ncbi:MAG: hypothetical protein H6502_03720 [Candidatus Woesearchaeota archaeon]|nr:MAG: hypothetical protein H6502_03720 [Candidatus Woesearchaeota archaeon]
MKCAVCGQKIEILFLEKINGTYLRDEKGKKHVVCATCQQQHPIKELREKL